MGAYLISCWGGEPTIARSASFVVDLDVVIGTRGSIDPPELCNGLMVPIVVLTRFTLSTAMRSSKPSRRPEKMTEKQFEAAAGEMLDQDPANDG